MAGHDLIDAYLAAITRRLPADAVDELVDGLTETYLRYLSTGLDSDGAARAAITEFGGPDQVVAAFVRHSPGRRTALMLLCSGPAVGVCWGAALVLDNAWIWPVPTPVRLTFAMTLLAVIAGLAVAAIGSASYRRTELAAVAGVGVVALDCGMLAAVALVAPPFAWPMILAIPASLIRLTLTTRALPRILAN